MFGFFIRPSSVRLSYATSTFGEPISRMLMSTFDKLLASGFLGLLSITGTTLTGCTPAATTALDWQIANQTADTLVVTTRYALDSTVLSPDEVKRWTLEDSVYGGGQGVTGPLHRVAHHQGRWYLVEEANYSGIMVYMYGGTNNTEITQAQVDPVHGRVTYRVPPGNTQFLAGREISGSTQHLDAAAQRPPFVVLHLQQGLARQTLEQGPYMTEAFQKRQTGREYNNNSHYLFQLTVGPKLTLNKN